MGRVVKEYNVRLNEILDTARKFVYTKGYEQTTIQDILDALQISKGAFYHYFDSKQELLEALLGRTVDEAEPILLPIVHDPSLTALEKLRKFFATASRWKVSQKEYFLALLRVWYADENAIVREKTREMSLQRIGPMVSTIIQQGIGEGVMSVPYPDQIGDVVWSMLLGMSDKVAGMMLQEAPAYDRFPLIERTIAAYTEATERILAAPPASLEFIDTESLREWAIAMEERVPEFRSN